MVRVMAGWNKFGISLNISHVYKLYIIFSNTTKFSLFRAMLYGMIA